MENTIRNILRNKLSDYHQGFNVPHYNEDIINIQVFNAFELNFENLDDIWGNVSFRCWVQGKNPKIAKKNMTFSFTFSGVQAVMDGNQLVDLNINNMVIPSYERTA